MSATEFVPAFVAQLDASRLTLDDLRREYDAVDAALAAASTEGALQALLEQWDRLKRRIDSQVYLAELRFRQDTASETARADSDASAALSAAAQGRAVEVKRVLLAHPLRGAMETKIGAYAFERWATDVLAFDPALEAAAVREAALYKEYTERRSSARTMLDGKEQSIVSLMGALEDADRDTRRAATLAMWSIYEELAEPLDRIFDELVQCRASMAGALGYESFLEVAYKRLGRTDYGPTEVARFRDAIRREIVPLAQRIVDDQAAALGVDAVMPWDERVFDRLPSFALPDIPALERALADAFAVLHPELGAFAELMLEHRMLDLEERPNKSAGGFCTFIPDARFPFVFGNVNGTSHDVTVLVHEMGHAFQCYASRDKAMIEDVFPTYDAAEIHSIGMEFLMWREYGRFLGDEAERFRLHHLRTMLLMMPYIAAVDHFQELVYAKPKATPAERNAMWLEMEQTYMPFRTTGDIPHLARGGRWQRQLHIYGNPFYYVDYGLATCCALQLWAQSRRDRTAALATYVALCKRGGDSPFQALVASAGLRSPFAPGALATVIQDAREVLGL